MSIGLTLVIKDKLVSMRVNDLLSSNLSVLSS